VLWSLLLLLLAGLLLAWEDDPLQLGLLAGAAGATLLVAALLLLRAPAEPARASSWSTVLLALGATALVLGAVFGSWLLLPGAGLSALGLGGLLREAR
jgi:hypothetical protein